MSVGEDTGWKITDCLGTKVLLDSDRGATTRMLTPLRNRFVHLELEVETVVAMGDPGSNSAFFRFRPELLSVFDRDAHAFPSPLDTHFRLH